MITGVFADGKRGIESLSAQLPQDLDKLGPRPAPEFVFSLKDSPRRIQGDAVDPGVAGGDKGTGRWLGQNRYCPAIGKQTLQGGGHEGGVTDAPKFEDEAAFHDKTIDNRPVLACRSLRTEEAKAQDRPFPSTRYPPVSWGLKLPLSFPSRDPSNRDAPTRGHKRTAS